MNQNRKIKANFTFTKHLNKNYDTDKKYIYKYILKYKLIE